jgi:nucleotide-binding universal stress UspA family protein
VHALEALAVNPWIVGLDTRGLSRGALVFAAWLREHGVHGHAPEAFIGAHIFERAHVPALLGRPADRPDWLGERARETIEAMIAEVGPSPLDRVQWEDGVTADVALADLADQLDAAALVIGRRAMSDDGSLLRLGRTARRLLRKLPAPVIIVPPDFEGPPPGDGPVLCAVDLRDRSLAPARFAVSLAGHLGRRCQLLHAVPLPETLDYYRGDDALRRELVEELQREATVALERWCEEHGLFEQARTTLVGDPADVIHRRIDAGKAPLLVCGSRQLALVRRLFSSSLGSYLAATAPVPVAIVPAETTV